MAAVGFSGAGREGARSMPCSPSATSPTRSSCLLHLFTLWSTASTASSTYSCKRCLHFDHRALNVRHACVQCFNLAICVAVSGDGEVRICGILQIHGALLEAMEEMGPWTKAGSEGELVGVGPGEGVWA